MDGNNRWSIKNQCTKYDGYKKGANTLLKLSSHIFNYTDTKYISAFALSKNNLSRSKNLVSTLKKILNEFLNNILDENDFINFNIKFIGNRNFLNTSINKKIDQLDIINKYHKNLYIFINYSGMDDIERAAIKFKEMKYNKSKSFKFNDFLMTAGIPDPDILIRTGGFKRLSDFLIYQITFTELFFTKKLWPDLSKYDLKKIINKFYALERKFGL